MQERSQNAAESEKMTPEGAEREPKVSQRERKGSQREPKGSQREPKGSHREPKGSQRGAKAKKVAKSMIPGILLGVIFGPFSIKNVIKNRCTNQRRTCMEN